MGEYLHQLGNILKQRGVDVKYAIHPVAGRMPGHMNVLLAEANVPYEQLHEVEAINPSFPEADIAFVVGANDVTNPAAKNNKSSPLYGMPILEVDRAKSIIVLKRKHAAGLRRRRQRPLLQREVHDAVRRRQGQHHEAHHRDEVAALSGRPPR